MTWRTGRIVLRTVYENDQIMFLCTTPEEAARVVALLNKAEASEQIVVAERECCAKIAEDWNEGYSVTGRDIAAVIRSGNKKA